MVQLQLPTIGSSHYSIALGRKDIKRMVIYGSTSERWNLINSVYKTAKFANNVSHMHHIVTDNKIRSDSFAYMCYFYALLCGMANCVKTVLHHQIGFTTTTRNQHRIKFSYSPII